MAKVSLRIYNREIERLIEQGSIDEAIAHCRHILQTFPKHLETYRLLGKAYLEARRYGEAVDIFGRLLMAVPDDFVSHVGLSIIRDEENKLDDAIWHMERAFEVQSSNAAIQGELQRLYGRRDGMEPPKVRMTRGALSRIYVHGELYPQAIAEIRGVLAEDPQRVDMQLLLAYSYFKSGQRSDATDICNQLLKRYAYCFDANRIMIDLLPATAGTVETTQVYRMRISEMDPYSNFAKGSIFEIDEVPDASINLERLDYTGEEVQMGREWNTSSLGFSSVPPLGSGISATAEEPDWLRSSGEETPQDSAMPASESQTEEGIPDFLRDAGWGESSGPEQPSSIFDEAESADDIVQADIPDWLKSQAPSESAPAEKSSTPAETSDLLSGLDTSFDPFEGASSSSSDVPDWLKNASGTVESTPSIETSPAQPLDESNQAPDWMKDLDADSSQSESTAEEGDVPDWLAGLGGAPISEEVRSDEKPSGSPSEDEGIPNWLQSSDDASKVELPQERTAPAASVDSLGSSAEEQDDAVAWLESLAAKHGAKPEELVTDPNKRSETPPDWVSQAQNLGVQASTASEPEKPERSENAQNIGEEFFAEFEASVSESKETDETGMWLRNLDDEKESSASSSDDIPDWMKPEEEEPLERGSIPEWLDEKPVIENRASASLDTSSLPDWLGGLDEKSAAEESSSIPEDALVQNQDLSDWLSGLDDEPGLDIDPETLRAPQPPLETRQPVNEVKSGADEIPDWIKAEETEESDENAWQPPTASAPSKPEAASVPLSEELPEWLQSVDEEQAENTMTGDDAPPWVHREQYEEAEEDASVTPKPTSPSDWHPIAEEKQGVVNASIQQQGGEKRLVKNPPTPEPAATEKKKASSKQGVPRQRKSEAQGTVGILNLAKSELDRGDIPEALVHYGKLIKKGKHLEEVIGHLSESLYRYPVEVSIWQALGDAYMRANRLKEALDAYNKAEELIR
ncbi:MAG: tetratricopeptide repeat protein [Anaerolineales bacterium]|nr:tetratricopeptide repeat protein [Anaerolineales bacterium]